MAIPGNYHPGKYSNFVKVGNTGKYETLVLFLLKFSVMFV